MSDRIVAISDDRFQPEVLDAAGPVLVDFWAEWCGPCKMIAPILEQAAEDYADRIKICKLNVDDNPESAPKYGIRGIPTLILFRDGEVEDTKVGALSKAQLQQFLESHVG